MAKKKAPGSPDLAALKKQYKEELEKIPCIVGSFLKVSKNGENKNKVRRKRT